MATSGSFRFDTRDIPGVLLVTSTLRPDDRGHFAELYKKGDFEAGGLRVNFVQDNISVSKKHVLRGMHYQLAPKAQGKLVTALVGEIFDVVVDLRRDSPTYLKWLGFTLSATTKQSLYVPEGFAHGFCVLSDEACVLYKCTSEYDGPSERGISWCDPEIGIEWPVEKPILSPRDSALPPARLAEHSFALNH